MLKISYNLIVISNSWISVVFLYYQVKRLVLILIVDHKVDFVHFQYFLVFTHCVSGFFIHQFITKLICTVFLMYRDYIVKCNTMIYFMENSYVKRPINKLYRHSLIVVYGVSIPYRTPISFCFRFLCDIHRTELKWLALSYMVIINLEDQKLREIYLWYF